MNFELKKITLLIFTDIDGTFINNDTFHEGSNVRVAETLRKHNHLLVYNSSKTFDEIVGFIRLYRIYNFISARATWSTSSRS